jgi:hypothetical protein
VEFDAGHGSGRGDERTDASHCSRAFKERSDLPPLQEHGLAAAKALAERFADAVDHTIECIVRRPDSGAIWRHRAGYRFRVIEKPFQRWLLFYRQPDRDTIELVELIRGKRDLPRRIR